jgi:hypothetical protein
MVLALTSGSSSDVGRGEPSAATTSNSGRVNSPTAVVRRRRSSSKAIAVSNVSPYRPAVVGVALSIAYNLDLLALFEYQAAIPPVGLVITGLIISRGSNYFHDLVSLLLTSHDPPSQSNPLPNEESMAYSLWPDCRPYGRNWNSWYSAPLPEIIYLQT